MITKNVDKKKIIKIVLIAIAIILVIMVVHYSGEYNNYVEYANKYNDKVSDYNVVVDEYNKLLSVSSVDNIDGMPTSVDYKNAIEIGDIFTYTKYAVTFSSTKDIEENTNQVELDIEDLLSDYLILLQITNPSEEWVISCLDSIENIIEIEAVTEDNDPNGFLNLDGGYTSCIYFSVDGIDSDDVEGETIVDKGTDVGGSIEVYENSEDALIRCDYLSQFENTLLYSGSYAIVGTMVIRTSYILSDEEQVNLTNEITTALTTLE